MPSLFFNAFFVLLSGVLAGAAAAQPAYRCGNSYSQTPCPQAVIIDDADQRTPLQKAQADKATVRDARTANAMEQARLRQEAIDRANNTPPASKASAAKRAASAPDPGQLTKKKKKKPDHFALQVTSAKKKKPASKKTVAQKDGSKP